MKSRKSWILGLLAVSIVVGCATYQAVRSDWGKFAYSVSPKIEEKAGEIVTENVGPMDIRKSDDTLKNGYIDIKINNEYTEDGFKYLVWVYNHNDQNQGYQYTLNNFKDWTMMPLPYSDQYIVIFKQTSEDYDKSFTTSQTIFNNLGFQYMSNKYTVPTETVACFKINGAGDYKQNIDCFLNKTVWVYWEDNCDAVMFADRLKVFYPDEREYQLQVMHWLNNEVRYQEEKLDNRAGDKYYDFIYKNSTIRDWEGVCSDIAAAYCVMMRSQGIPCQYVEGYAAGDQVDGSRFEGIHAWNYAYNDGNFTAYDPTNDVDFVTQEYVIKQVK